MNETKVSVGEEKAAVSKTPHQHVVAVVGTIAGFAFGTYVLGALLGAPWPAAVASCGLSVMGMAVAIVMLRRA